MNKAPSLTAVALPAAALHRTARFADYLELTKPGLSLLSVLTALAGYAAARPAYGPGRLLALAAGTALAAGGVAALNQFLESDTDAQMHRTRQRPIPTGRVANGSAYVLGAALCFAGVALLFARVNGLAALGTGLTIVTYLFWYTPAKRTSRWSTEIGAVAGALPPVIGWVAGADRMSGPGWLFFGLLFFWQIPHFLAVAWRYRHDYAAVHFPLLAVRDPSGRAVAAWSFTATGLLVGLSLLPVQLGFCTWAYGTGALVLGAGFLALAAGFLRRTDRQRSARRLFLGSIAYLPLLLGLLVADRLLAR